MTNELNHVQRLHRVFDRFVQTQTRPIDEHWEQFQADIFLHASGRDQRVLQRRLEMLAKSPQE